jgi:hypothetical protein
VRRLTDRERVDALLDEVARLQYELAIAQVELARVTTGAAACLDSTAHLPEAPAEPSLPTVPAVAGWETVLPVARGRRNRFL